MTDLTEYTWYYCKMKNGDIQMLERGGDYFLSGDVPLLNNEIKEVLAPVPSYEEYLSLTYAKEEDEGIIAEYEAENTKLKELLRKAKGIITAYRLTGNQSTYSNDNMKECVAQIEQALGEDK